MIWILAAGLCFGLLAVAPPVRAQTPDPPLPDAERFLREVRKHLQSDELRLSVYTYIEKRREVRVSPLGKVTTGPLRVFEVYPSADPEQPYKRLISVDGVPLGAAELEAQDREWRAAQEQRARRRAREGASERQQRERERADATRREQAAIEDLVRLYEIHLVRRETMDGHSTIVVSFAPRPDVRPRTDQGKILKKARGRAWISETDHEIVRVEAETIEDITVGLGLIARLHKGSKAIFVRRKVDGEAWLPAEYRFVGTGRTLLFRTFKVEAVTEYSDYRRADRRAHREGPETIVAGCAVAGSGLRAVCSTLGAHVRGERRTSCTESFSGPCGPWQPCS